MTGSSTMAGAPRKGGVVRSGQSLLSYRDPETGVAGHLAFDGDAQPLAAGGFRVQKGFTADTAMQLAQVMTRKQQLLGLAVDGAKCGIDLDPLDPRKPVVMRRFLRFLRPHLLGRYSMGPDMGTRWEELEALARAEGLPSVKIAVARAQGLSDSDFSRRRGLLDVPVGGATLGQRRAGHGLVHVALPAADRACRGADGPVRVGIQGLGTLGRAAALSVLDAGLPVTAVADEHGCLRAADGWRAETLLTAIAGTTVPQLAAAGDAVLAPRALLTCEVDVLILAGSADAMTPGQAAQLPDSVRVVAVGANLGLSAEVEDHLSRRGVVVLPDFVGGCGGSASMDALFGPAACPTAEEVLDRTGRSMRSLGSALVDHARASGSTVRQAALTLCEQRARERSAARPYGCSSP